MSTAMDLFSRQEALLTRARQRITERLEDGAKLISERHLATIGDNLDDLPKLHALSLCERVTRLVMDKPFEEAFLTVYDAAKARLLRNEYGQRSSSEGGRFMGEVRREGDAYFVDRFEIVAVGIAQQT